MSVNENAIQRMKELVELLREADIAYYRDNNPIMSDRSYDQLTEELQNLESETGLILSSSPTHRVSGEILEALVPVRHTRPMLSADKTKSIQDVIKFADSRPVLLSWKMDGLTLVLRYENGELVQAITRGREGIIGEDVTHTARTFLNIPLTIPTKEALEVRGEGVVSWANFNQINSGLEEPYSHPRGLAAGSTRKLDANESRKRMLEFFAFELVSDHLEKHSKLSQQQLLEHNGFSVVPYVYVDNHDPAQLREVIESFKPEEYAYAVDGIICEYDDLLYGASLGATGHHANRLMALKWEDELYETQFLGLDMATTRTGMVSLTAILKPVMIDGSEISRAYLHNLDIFDEFQFGVGDTVAIYKSNKIIPQIAENRTMSNTFELPMTCPCCGSDLIRKASSGGTHQLYCENPNCSAKLVRRFTHFCEKTRMGIEGLSETTLSKFVSHGWIKNFGDLFELEKHREEIISTDGFGVKSYERLQANIQKARYCTLAKFIASLGIPMVGRHAGRDLDRYFHGSWAEFEAAILNGFDFTQLPDFGQTMHDNIYKWYPDAEEAELWRPALRKVYFIKEKENMNTNQNNPFNGKTVVATGKLMSYTREGIQNKLLSLGAIPTASVTKKTDFLIVGEKAGSKLTKAQQLDIRTLTESEFETMLESSQEKSDA